MLAWRVNRYFMRIEVLDVVAGEDGIDTCIRHRRHVGHRAGDVGIDRVVDVEEQFGPDVGVETARCPVLALGAATDMQEGFLDSTCNAS